MSSQTESKRLARRRRRNSPWTARLETYAVRGGFRLARRIAGGANSPGSEPRVRPQRQLGTRDQITSILGFDGEHQRRLERPLERGSLQSAADAPVQPLKDTCQRARANGSSRGGDGHIGSPKALRGIVGGVGAATDTAVALVIAAWSAATRVCPRALDRLFLKLGTGPESGPRHTYEKTLLRCTL